MGNKIRYIDSYLRFQVKLSSNKFLFNTFILNFMVTNLISGLVEQCECNYVHAGEKDGGDKT